MSPLKQSLQALARRQETALALALLGLSLAIGLVNPAFFSTANLFDLLKSSVVTGIFAIGVMIVLASGGIDISFTAIAAFSMYLTCRTLVAIGFEGTACVALLMSALVGAALGLFNATFIWFFRLPTLIVTLGTASLFRGFMLAFIGTAIVNNLPPGLIAFSRLTLWSHAAPGGETVGLSATVLLLGLVALGTWAFLRYALLGRGIYALGGNPEAAARVGFNLTRLHFLIYGGVGGLSGLGGILHAVMMRNANPFDLVGSELEVIAAAVLGGASITGGRGTVLGTVLGVWLIVVTNNSLILLGIPAYWQKVVTGLIIITSTWIAAHRHRSQNATGLVRASIFSGTARP